MANSSSKFEAYMTVQARLNRDFDEAAVSAILDEVCDYLGTIPEYTQLLDTIGRIEFVVENCLSPAYCDFENSCIKLDPSLFEKKCGNIYPLVVESILFEMNNYTEKAAFDCLLSGARAMTPDQFVEEFERLEHRSALKTKAILRKHFEFDLWKNASLSHIPNDFRLHYLKQQVTGHSQDIWARLSHLFPQGSDYRGIWKGEVAKDEKTYVLALLDLYGRISDPVPAISVAATKNLHFLKRHIRTNRENPELSARLSGRIREIERKQLLL